MTREERNELLADLRAASVEEAHFHSGALAFVKFFPAPAPARPEERMPRRQRTDDERLFGNLRIGEGQPKIGGEG